MNTFKIFPTDPSLYKEEYAGFIEEITNMVLKSGRQLYSLMKFTDISAFIQSSAQRPELWPVNISRGSGKLKVTSYAGNRPLWVVLMMAYKSVMGATIGQGLIYSFRYSSWKPNHYLWV